MTASVSYSSRFEPLTQAFKRYFKEIHPWPQLTALDCHTDRTHLWVLAMHSAPPVEHPAELFQVLKTGLYELMPEVGLPDGVWAERLEIPIRLGLQLEHEATPYATHDFIWRLEDAMEIIFDPSPVASSVLADGFDRADPTAGDTSTETISPSCEVEAPASEASSSSNDALLVLDKAAPSHDIQSALQRWHPWGVDRLQQVASYWGYGLAGLILMSGGLLTYTLTRPCVVGGCDRIAEAKTWDDSALSRVTADSSRDDLQKARSELQTAASLVSPIPHWSRHYETAQADWELYQSHLAGLDHFLAAKDKASTAAQKSQNPPHPIQHWSEVEHYWRQAVILLEQVPTNSQIYPYVQPKLAEYRTNADAITRRISIETAAEAHLNSALAAARLAQQRMGTAKTAADWQAVTQRWQSAILKLSLIPQGTAAYAEAQRYRADYQQQLGQLRGQANQERIAATSLQQAQEAANQAKTYADNNQWTLAVTQWKIASASLRGLPSGSPLANSARELIPIYQARLTQAQNQLETAVTLQTLRTHLREICRASATACGVNSSSNQVLIRLPSRYVLALELALTPPQGPAVSALNPDAQALIQSIIQAGNQLQRPIEIYDVQGSFVARYRPELGGFTKN